MVVVSADSLVYDGFVCVVLTCDACTWLIASFSFFDDRVVVFAKPYFLA